jgi:hypothetical protein
MENMLAFKHLGEVDMPASEAELSQAMNMNVRSPAAGVSDFFYQDICALCSHSDSPAMPAAATQLPF